MLSIVNCFLLRLLKYTWAHLSAELCGVDTQGHASKAGLTWRPVPSLIPSNSPAVQTADCNVAGKCGKGVHCDYCHFRHPGHVRAPADRYLNPFENIWELYNLELQDHLIHGPATPCRRRSTEQGLAIPRWTQISTESSSCKTVLLLVTQAQSVEPFYSNNVCTDACMDGWKYRWYCKIV